MREFPACVAHLDLLAVDPHYMMDGYLADLEGVAFAPSSPSGATASSGQRISARSPRARDPRGRFTSSRSGSVRARAMSP